MHRRIATREPGVDSRHGAGAPLSETVAEALTDMTDAAAPRRASIDARAPRGILQALLAFATASAMLMAMDFPPADGGA